MHISEMQKKIHKKSFIFEIMSFELGARNCAHCNEEYLLWAVNVLTNSVKISDQTNADFFQLNISQMHGKIG